MYTTNFVTVFMGIVIVQASSLNETIDTKLRIFGGKEASPGEFPFLVSLQFVETSGKHRCGGSIIRPKWILTAAHCLISKINAYIVKAGKHEINVTEPYEQIVKVKSTHPHEKYHGEAAYDIALLELEKELSFNDRVRSIVLPVPRSLPKASERLTLAGWGAIRATMDPNDDNSRGKVEDPSTLQKIDVFPVDLHSCRAQLRNTSLSYPHENNLCATGKSACWGDSGSSLINQDRKVIGIVIEAYPCCCAADFPDLYVRVSAFIGWIEDRLTNKPTSTTPRPRPRPSKGSKDYLAHLLIPLQICSLFTILQFNYSL